MGISTRERLALPPGVAGLVWRHRYAGGTRKVHRHEELELNLVTAGRAAYLTMGRRYDLPAGTAVWLFPDQDHVLLGESPDFEMWIVVWKPGLVRRTCRSAETRALRRRMPAAASQFCKRLGSAAVRRLDALLAEVAGCDGDRQLAGLAYLLTVAWAEHAAADALDPGGRAVHPAVKEAARLLRDEPGAVQWKLPELAERSGLSPSRLSRLFKAETGVALVEFRQRMQLDRFLALHDGSTGKLLPAALAAGFGSYPQFYRVYRRLMGRGPGKRKEMNPRGAGG
jgi:AraC-like DNA-binding protein